MVMNVSAVRKKVLTNAQKERLKANWGDKAKALECKAEVRVYDPLSSWECFIYAMDPNDEDVISCVLNGCYLEVAPEWNLSTLQTLFNEFGLSPEVDKEFRPKYVREIIIQLGRGEYE